MILPDNKPFTIRCPVEQTDRFQKDFIEAYEHTARQRQRATAGLIIIPLAFVSLAVLLALAPGETYGFAALFLFFAVLYAAYFGYRVKKGYRKELLDLQQLLARAVDSGRTVYEPMQMCYEFGFDRVEIVYNGEGATRYFLYEDVSYLDETDRMYIIGIRRDRRRVYLTGLDYILITKRALESDETEALRMTLRNIAAQYEVPLNQGRHPFR